MSKRAGMVAVVAALALAASTLTLPTGPAVGAPPVAPPGRLAFTDAKSSVRELILERPTTEGTPYLTPVSGSEGEAEAPQSGQASGQVGPSPTFPGGLAFVSTRPVVAGGADDSDGEVWFDPRGFSAAADVPVLVTDDAAHESNPVVWAQDTSCDGVSATVQVAYASDRSGNWDIWVATLVAEPGDSAECLPFALRGEPRQITTDPGDDLWPAWSYAQNPDLFEAPDRSIIFSSTRSDPRGDLYQVVYDPEGTTPPDPGQLTQLTEGPAADSQPAPRLWVGAGWAQTCPGDVTVGTDPPLRIEPRWLAFTTATDDDPRGGLALLDLDDPGAGVVSLGVSPASEPAWSPEGAFLAYRSTAGDPEGDVLVGYFVRTCAPDLSVSVSVTPPDPVADQTVEVSITVSNNSTVPTTGSVTIDFTSLLSTPGAPCDAQLCTLRTDEIVPGGSQTWGWDVASKTALQAIAVGTQDLTATVTADPPGSDAVPSNDTQTVRLTVNTPPASPGLAPTGPEVAALAAIPATTSSAGGRGASAPTRSRPSMLAARLPSATAGSARTTGVPARAPAAIGAAVPGPVGSPIADTFALEGITTAAGTFGVAESHPSFRGAYLTDSSGPASVTLLITVRPTGSGISDVLSIDGSDRRRLVEGRLFDGDHYPVGHPTYSPDGRFMAFHAFTCDRPSLAAEVCTLGSGIIVARADGTDPAPIYPASEPRAEGTQDVNPAWSPDGTAIAFTRTVPATEVPAPAAIWVARGLDLSADPVPPADLVADSVEPLTTPVRAEFSFEIDEFDDEAAWSPDGLTIAFTRARLPLPRGAEELPPQGDYDSDIWLVDVGSGAEQPLLTTEVGAEPGEDGPCQEQSADPDAEDPGTVCFGGDDRGADWSPDGARIAYEHTGWLYLADPATQADLGPVTGPRILDPADDRPLYPDDPPPATTPAADPTAAFFPDLDWAQDPSWSPNGDRIAFAGQPRGHPEQRGIYWLTVPTDPAAREVREIAQQPQPELQPDWQPTADLALTLTAAPATILTGAGSVLTAFVSNEGSAVARSTSVTVTLPAGLTPGPLPSGCAGAPVVCAVGDIATGGSVTLALPVVGGTAGTHVTSATVTSRTEDPDPSDNSATASVTVVSPTAPSADLSITLTPAPPTVLLGGAAALTAVVTNSGPDTSQGTIVAVVFPVGLTPGALPAGCVAGAPVSCAVADLPSGASVTLTFPVIGASAGSLATLATVSGSTPDPDPVDNSATAVIQVGAVADVSVAVELGPNPGYVGGPVTVTVTTRNAGPIDSGVLLVVTVPNDSGPTQGEACVTPAGCDLGLIASGDEVVTSITLTPVGALRGPVRAEVSGSILDTDLTNNTDQVKLTVLQPTLQLLPPLGPPGFVTLAVGEDFPPGARLVLTWDPGLNASDASLEVADDGTFDTPIAVLMRDQLGPRTITATRTSGLEFSPVEVDFLVVPRTQQPPDFEGRG